MFKCFSLLLLMSNVLLQIGKWLLLGSLTITFASSISRAHTILDFTRMVFIILYSVTDTLFDAY